MNVTDLEYEQKRLEKKLYHVWNWKPAPNT